MAIPRPSTALIPILLLASGPAAAWEADVHYGLVKWLAYQAGLSLEDAELVAASSQAADETHVLMATYLIAEVCARGKAPKVTTVSRVVQQHHFPAGNYVPNSPASRDVGPGHYGSDKAGNRWIRQEIADTTATISPVVRLERFGSAIHPLADSWSHAGEPDVPNDWGLRCRQPELVWSHPQTRGGWKSHDADLTHLHVGDTLETAATVYRFMGDFLTQHTQFAERAPARWPVLEPRIRQFAERDTRDAKFGWFMDEDARHQANPDEGLPYDRFRTYPCFLDETSLQKRKRGDDYPRTRCADPEITQLEAANRPSPPPPVPLRNEPDSPWVFTNQLLETWLVRRDVTRVVEDMTAVPAVARQFPAVPPGMERRAVELLLRSWLADDHGALNELDHGANFRSLEAFLSDTSVSATGVLAPATYDSLADVASHPCSSLPFELIRNDFASETPDGEATIVESYVVVFRIKHAPRDLMLLTIERVAGDWTLTSVAWAAQ